MQHWRRSDHNTGSHTHIRRRRGSSSRLLCSQTMSIGEGKLWMKFWIAFVLGFVVQNLLCFGCVPRCLRYQPIITAGGSAATCQCPTMTRSFCSTPFIRVSWSLMVRSGNLAKHSTTICLFAIWSVFFVCLHGTMFVCSRASGMLLMGILWMSCQASQMTGRDRQELQSEISLEFVIKLTDRSKFFMSTVNHLTGASQKASW